jgi:hypothetical protein
VILNLLRLTPNKSNKRGARRVRQNKSSGRSVDSEIINSHKASGATTNVVKSDLVLTRQNFNIVQSPPKQLSNQIFWCEMSVDDLISLSNTAVTEANVTYAASSFSAFSAAAAFFDQYCIYAVTTTISSLLVEASYGAIQCYTAIDYDSAANVGKSGILSFSSANYTSLGSGGQSSLIRFIKPCIAPQVTSSNLPVAGGVGRMWLDCAYPSVQHYALRNLYDIFSSSVTNAVHRVHTAVIGFRNNQ